MNILFVCTGNTCRSAMAAAMFNQIATEKNLDVRIESAGLAAYEGDTASENAINVMREMGIDLSYHRSKPITDELLNVADVVLVMTEGQKSVISGNKVYTLKEYVGDLGDITDPYGGGADIYRETAHEIKEALYKLAERINDNT